MNGIPPAMQKALLEWSLKEASFDQGSKFEPMSDEKREWLEAAIQQHFKDPIVIIKALFASITPEKTQEEIEAILDELEPLVSINGISEYLDEYDGFNKLFFVMEKKNSIDNRMFASRLIADAIQSNPLAQEKCWAAGEKFLVSLASEEDPVDMRIAINVISPLVRNNHQMYNKVSSALSLDEFISRCIVCDKTKSKAEFLKEDIELSYKSTTIQKQ